MASRLLVALVSAFVLLLFGGYRYYFTTSRPNYDFDRLFGICIALAGGLGYVLLPAAWFVGSFALRRGTAEANLLPGSSLEDLMLSLVLGSMLMTWDAGRVYYAYIKQPPRKTQNL